MPKVLDVPIDIDNGTGSGWVVTVFNDDVTPYESVIKILMQATSCPREEAEMETWEIHHLGKAVVHHSGEEECKTIASVISSIGIKVEVSSE